MSRVGLLSSYHISSCHGKSHSELFEGYQPLLDGKILIHKDSSMGLVEQVRLVRSS